MGCCWYREKPLRWAKTLFFLLHMLASLLLVCAPPLLIVLLDVLLPSALLPAATSSFSDSPTIFSQFESYRFRSSLIDVPIVSIARSLLILCAYLVWEGRGPYLGITSACSLGSIGFVAVKAAAVFGGAGAAAAGRRLLAVGSKEGAAAVEALFVSSVSLAVAHVLVAYKTSCRARRKMIVYKIDIEAVKLKAVKL